MRKVGNQKVIRRIADRTRQSAKGKNVIAVLAIALTSLLFTTVFTVGGSIMDKQQKSTMRHVGTSSHAGFKYLTQAEYDIVKKDKKIKEVSCRRVVAEAVNKELNKLRTEVCFFEDQDAKWSFCYPEKGHMPEERDEIVLSDLVLEALGIPCEIGARVPLALDIGGVKRDEVFTLCGYYKGDKISQAQMAAVSRKYADETAPTPTESAMDGWVDSTGYAGRIMADFNFRISMNLEKQARDLAVRCGFPETVDTGVNWAYMSMEVDSETLIFTGVLLLIILMSGYLIIYNIFYISVFQDIRYYGLLKTVGTTGKQLKKIVRRQAYMLSLYGIPIGLLGGVAVGKIILPILMRELTFGSSKIGTDVELSVWIFAGAACFSFMTVYISCAKPCRVVSKVSPIEAVRSTEGQQAAGKDGAGKRRAGKEKKTRHVSPREMAFQNIKRNKKKVIVVILSLSLAFILLNSVYSLVMGFDMERYISYMAVSDFSVADATVGNMSVDFDSVVLDGVTEEFEEALNERKGIEDIGNIYIKNDNIMLNETDFSRINERIFENPDFRSLIEMRLGNAGSMEQYIKQMQDGRWMDGKIYGISEMAAREIEPLEDAEEKDIWEKFRTGKYVLVNGCSPTGEGEMIHFFEPGEKITLYDAKGKEKEYEVLALAELPTACQLQTYGMVECNILLPEDEFLGLFGKCRPMRKIFNVKPEYEKETETWISDYCENVEPNLKYNSRAQIEKEFESTKNMYIMVGGLLSLILALIGILNFINTMITSILSRKQEFAMMEAVGMTGKQLRRMLCFEGAYYAALAGGVSLIMGCVTSATAVRAIGEAYFFFKWKLTVLPIGLCIPVLLFVVLSVPAVYYGKMCTNSIVERMRRPE